MMPVADHETFELGVLTLRCGLTLPGAHLAYKTYGTLAPDKSNVILYPTSFGAHHTDIEWLIGRQRVLDPERYFIVIPNQFGNGLSTSPSNLAEPFGLGRNPPFTHWDNVHAQERLLREKIRHHPPGPCVRVVHGRPAGAALGSLVPRPCRPHLRGMYVGAHEPAQQGLPRRHSRDAYNRCCLARRTLCRTPVAWPARVRACLRRLGNEPGVLSRKALGECGVCIARGLPGARLGRQFPAPPGGGPLVDDRHLVSIRHLRQPALQRRSRKSARHDHGTGNHHALDDGSL